MFIFNLNYNLERVVGRIKIGDINFNGITTLAPMAGITDRTFRTCLVKIAHVGIKHQKKWPKKAKYAVLSWLCTKYTVLKYNTKNFC